MVTQVDPSMPSNTIDLRTPAHPESTRDLIVEKTGILNNEP